MIENREKQLSQLDIPAKMRITPKVFSKKKLSRKFTKKRQSYIEYLPVKE
jgi:hypothetical protein